MSEFEIASIILMSLQTLTMIIGLFTLILYKAKVSVSYKLSSNSMTIYFFSNRNKISIIKNIKLHFLDGKSIDVMGEKEFLMLSNQENFKNYVINFALFPNYDFKLLKSITYTSEKNKEKRVKFKNGKIYR
ncbi:MAG: hypothetical protein K2M08_00065 [Anaeroplasmataceae bacterium]|nr:hypothetical protein [Anaeroplasmataceae bacterium]